MTENTERHIGPYELVGLLGRGGSSSVYEAVDQRDGHVVALKVVTAASDAGEDDTLTRRMERSRRAMASLDHPNIARVYETGEAPLSDAPAGAPYARYIAMERIEGTTLRERLKREGGPLSLAESADILGQVARGVDAVHAAGVIHRDIKPSNILLGVGGIVKLTDFGIARRANDTMVTIEGVMIGSPNYISPEQTNNQPATPASDLWSLGVVLYEMVVGRVPFSGENIPATLYQIAHGDLPALPVHLPPPVRDVLTRALDRDPARRYPSATGLAEAFRLAVEPARTVAAARLPAPVPVEPTRYSTTKRRSFAPLALAMLGGVALVAGGFLAAPRMTTTAGQGTRVVSDMEKRPATPAAKAARRPARKATPAARAGKSQSADARDTAQPATMAAGNVAEAAPTPSPAPSPTAESTRSAVVATPSPSPSVPAVVVPETPPSPSLIPRTRRRRDMPVAIAPAQPPLEVSRDLPPLDIEPLPKTVPRPTPRPTPVPETPSPTPTPIPPPGPPARAARISDSNDNEEGALDVDPNTRLAGTWRGNHTGHSARLVIRARNTDTGEFRGTLIVQMPSGPVRIAVNGQVFDDGGITIRETRVLQASEERAWDLGTNTGTFDPDDLTLSGQGRDKRGRTYQWSFQR